jgi:hypothetical protein
MVMLLRSKEWLTTIVIIHSVEIVRSPQRSSVAPPVRLYTVRQKSYASFSMLKRGSGFLSPPWNQRSSVSRHPKFRRALLDGGGIVRPKPNGTRFLLRN